MFKNKIDKYHRKTGYTSIGWTLDKPMASLFTCHQGVLPWITILLNLYDAALFEQLIKWHDSLKCGCSCVDAYVCLSSNHVDVALQIY